MTYPAVLVFAHEERSLAWAYGRLHLDEILGPSAVPCVLVEISMVDQDLGQNATGVIICNIRRLASLPGQHIRVVWVDRCVFPDCTLPVLSGKLWEYRIES